MSKPRKKKNYQSRSTTPNYTPSSKRDTTEDFVGKFLLSTAVALVAALITLALSNQINWLVVVLAFVICLYILTVYQKRD